LAPTTAHPAGGLTLIEAMIALAVMALLLTLALPSFGDHLARQRLKAAAEMLAADLAEARFEAAQRGQPLYVGLRGGSDWCYAASSASGCDCRVAQSCRLRVVAASDAPGLTLQAPPEIAFQPAGHGAPATVVWTSTRGHQVRVELSAMGRVRLCAPEVLSGVPRC
jgi:type IV fimbrial biogenesis protein FimT